MSWEKDAACRAYGGEFFFAPDDEMPKPKAVRIARAKAICADCPVTEQCLAYADRHEVAHGIWGGLTEKERGRDPHRHAIRDCQQRKAS